VCSHDVRCAYCQLYLSPNKFIFHFHRVTGSRYHHPDAANFNSWRRHLTLDYVDPSEELVHAWEDVKAMFNGGSRKRLASPLPAAAAKGRVSAVTSAGGTERREVDCTATAKRQRVADDGGRFATALATTTTRERSANCVPRPPPGFYLQSLYTGPRTNTASPITQPSHHYPFTVQSVAPVPAPQSMSVQSTSTAACLPYYDVIRMQMLHAAGDVWKARAAAAAAAAAAGGACPLAPPINMILPPPTTPSVDFLSALGRPPPRNPLEQFLAMSSSSALTPYRQQQHQRSTLPAAMLDDIKPLREAACRRPTGSPLPPLAAEPRKPFSAFRLVSDVDASSACCSPVQRDDHDVTTKDNSVTSVDVDDDDDDNNCQRRLDSNANRCHIDMTPIRDDKINRNDSRCIADSHASHQQRHSTEVQPLNRLAYTFDIVLLCHTLS